MKRPLYLAMNDACMRSGLASASFTPRASNAISGGSMGLSQRLMAHGFAGCLCSIFGSIVGITWGYLTGRAYIHPGGFDPQLDEYLMHIPSFAIRFLGTSALILVGAITGSLMGFVIGAGANIWIVRRSDRTKLPPAADA